MGANFSNGKRKRKVLYAVFLHQLCRAQKTMNGVVFMKMFLAAIGLLVRNAVITQFTNRLVIMMMKNCERHLHVQETDEHKE